MWLMFIIVCFIFELSALEIPSVSLMNRETKFIVGLMVFIILINILLMIYSFQRNINVIFMISMTTQFSFILCNLKTSHHEGLSTNQNVVKNTCSARLILMALETSHLTSMAVKTDWLKYVMVNIVNVIMFSSLVIGKFDTATASFWQVG